MAGCFQAARTLACEFGNEVESIPKPPWTGIPMLCGGYVSFLGLRGLSLGIPVVITGALTGSYWHRVLRTEGS